MLFLDIEQTLIDSMDNPVSMEFVQSIFNFAKNESEIFIFSWAIHNEHDIDNFMKSHIKTWIEQNCDVKLERKHIISKESLISSFRIKIPILDLPDFHDLCCDKELAFEMFCRFDPRAGNNTEFCLIDDTVQNKTIHIKNKVIEFLHIDNFRS